MPGLPMAIRNFLKLTAKVFQMNIIANFPPHSLVATFRRKQCEKMIKHLLILLNFICVNISAQISILPIDSSSGKIIYQEVCIVDSVGAKELLSRSKIWFAKTFNSSKDVLQNIDDENHIIIGKALMRAHAQFYGERTWGYVKYSVSIYCKDNRFKYVITDFYHEGDAIATASTYTPSVGLLSINTIESGGFSGYRKKDLDRLCVEINENINLLVKSLKIDMNKKIETKSDKW